MLVPYLNTDDLNLNPSGDAWAYTPRDIYKYMNLLRQRASDSWSTKTIYDPARPMISFYSSFVATEPKQQIRLLSHLISLRIQAR